MFQKKSWGRQTLLFVFLFFPVNRTLAFCNVAYFRPKQKRFLTRISSSTAPVITGVVAPLKFIGPYPCLTLRFPDLNQTVLDFLLDTGANVNSIPTKIAQDLELPLVQSFESLPLIGMSTMASDIRSDGHVQHAGDLYKLGDCQLHGLPQNRTFMTNLMAAALPYASPVGEGLLSLIFFQSFAAGVEFDWYGTDGDPPTLIFYLGKQLPPEAKRNMIRVPLQPVNQVGLFTLIIQVNGVEMLAILDTGAPITVLSQEAAKLAGIEKGGPPAEHPALKISGVTGNPIDVQVSNDPVSIRAGSVDNSVSLGEGRVCIGDLPGMKIIEEIAATDRDHKNMATVVLGLDFLRRAYRMTLRAPQNEVWFEELREDQPKWSQK